MLQVHGDSRRRSIMLRACILLGCLDLAWMYFESGGFPSPALLVVEVLLVCTAVGLGLGAALELVIALVRSLASKTTPFHSDTSKVRGAIWSVIALPYTSYFASGAFSGAWVSKQPWAPYAIVTTIGALSAVVYLSEPASRWLTRRTRVVRTVVAITAGASALLVHHANARLFVGLYEVIHEALAILTFVLLFLFLRHSPWGTLPLGAGTRGLHQRRTLRNVVTLAAASGAALLLNNNLVRTGLEQSVLQPRLLEMSSYWIDGHIDQTALPASSPTLPPVNVPPRYLGKNVILIVLDAVRPDHLPTYGYARATAPNIQALSESSIVFERAYAQGNHTARSMQGLIFGVYPWRVEDGRTVCRRWLGGRKRPPGLAAQFHQLGYTTLAVVHIYKLLKRLKIDQGFDTFVGKQDEQIVATAGDLLEKRATEKFFLMLFFRAAHGPYRAHEGHDFGNSKVDLYDAEIAAADEHVGSLLRYLESKELVDETIVVLLADHGEYLGEHRHWAHGGSSLYEPVIRIPLLMRIPGLAPRRIANQVELVDVAPTLLGIVGRVVEPSYNGENLSSLLFGSGDHTSVALASTCPKEALRAAIRGQDKLLYDGRTGTYKLIDLHADPGEKENLYHPEDPRVQRLRGPIMTTQIAR